ncbi:MAG: integrin alpha, partial [Myxococcota bacterium]
ADGFDDVLIGAPGYYGTTSNDGAAFLHLGSAAGLEATPAWTVEPTDNYGAQFGVSVAAAGDVDADGYDDVLVGADRYGVAFTQEGRIYLFNGSSAGLSEYGWSVDEINQTYAYLGSCVGGGDFDDDGFNDLIGGASGWDAPRGAGLNQGRGYLYFGDGGGPGLAADWITEPSNQASSNFGGTCSGVGDVDADGYDDFAISAADWDGAATAEGRIFFFYGGSRAGCGDGICQAGETCDGCPTDCAFGADAFGYYGCAETPAVPPCPDISTTGSALTLANDAISAELPLGFTFDWYGTSFTTATVSANGKLGFPSTTSYYNYCLPNENNTIFALWDDLDPSDPAASMRTLASGSAPNRTFEVQWMVPYTGSSSTSNVDLRVVLHESTHDVEVCYVDTDLGWSSVNNGLTATTGIQGATSANFIPYSCNSAALTPGLVLRYVHP